MPKNDAATDAEIRFFDAAEPHAASAGHVSKETVNLCKKDRKDISPGAFCLLLTVFLAVLILIEFFFAYLPYRDLEVLESSLGEAQQQYEQLQSSMSDYDAVRDDYRKYTYEKYDKTIVDREDILDLLEVAVFPMGKVLTLNISNNTITLSLSGVLNTDIDVMQKGLREHALVQNVIISRTSLVGDEATVAMTIILKDAEGGKN